MHRSTLSVRWIAVMLVAAACSVTLAAKPADMAACMPSDTLVYVGWSQCLEPDAPALRLTRQAVQALAKLQEENEDVRRIAPLLDALIPLQTASCGLGFFGLTFKDGVPDVELALVVDAGDGNARLVDAIHRFLALSAQPDRITAHEIGGVRLESFAIPDSPLHALWGIHKDRFLLALGETAASKVIACLSGGTETLASAAELKFDRAKVAARLDGPFFCVYADVQRIVALGKQTAETVLGGLPTQTDEVLAALGITSVRSKYLHADRVDDKPRMMIFAHIDGPRQGLLALWQQPPLSDDDLKIVPKNAYWMEVTNLDLDALWKEALRVIGQISPDARMTVEGVLAASKQFTGFSITDDLLPALGNTWALFDAPDHGGILLSGTVLVAEVKNADAFQGILTRSIEMLNGALAGQDVSIKHAQTQRDGHTIHYVLIAGVPSPVAPAWSLINDRVVIGLQPQTVAVALKQIDPKTRGESILDQPDFQAARARLPKEAQGVGYLDSRYLTRLVYPFMTAFAQMGMSMLAKYGVELDLDVVPPLPEQLAKVTNYVGTSSTDSDGILYASIGGGAPLATVAGGTALATSILLPSLSRARELAKRAVSAANLRGIGQACHIYANDNEDTFPPTLDALVQAQFITPQQLESPLHGPGQPAYAYIPGQTLRNDPRNVLVYERPWDGEGSNALFVDGHVEFLKMPEFKQAVRETYVRLNRLKDLPPDFQE